MMENDRSPVGDVEVFEGAESENAVQSNGELTIATIVGFDDSGRPLLDYKGISQEKSPVAALSTLTLQQQHQGRQVAVMFVNQDIYQPVIIGLIKSRLDDLLDVMNVGEADVGPADDVKNVSEEKPQVNIDGQKVLLEGKEEIVLRCGESSITLTKSGKITIRGKYLLNRSTGVNRIMGGSVQVN